MRYLVTGITGQLGYDVVKTLLENGEKDVIAPTRNEMDLNDKDSIERMIYLVNPDVVIHCAAYTAVDNAETDVENAIKINATATKWITDSCRKTNSKLIYISTDYVFDGTKEGLYETNDKPNPLNVYGKSKLMGEEFVSSYDKSFIVRTSWVFGINGKNFVKTMLNLSNTRDVLTVVNDQFGSPTYTADLANLLYDMSKTEEYGIYHANNEGYCSWADFASYIMLSNQKNTKIVGIPSKDYPQKAVRPVNSKLSKKELFNHGFDLLPDWHDAIDRYNMELKQKVKTKF